MSKHTPGPWEMSDGGYILPNHKAIDAPSHGALALVVWKMEDDERSPKCEANARLIAAAPDLLEALQKLAIVMREIHDHWDNDRDMKVGKCLLALSGQLPGYDRRIDEIHAAIAKAEGQA